jgi:hypothetical protein
MSLIDRARGVSSEEIWGYRSRSLTRFSFINIARAFIPVIGLYDTRVVSIPPNSFIDLVIPYDVILSYFMSPSSTVAVYLNDGTRVSTFPFVSGVTTTALIPLRKGWALRLTNTSTTVTGSFRLKALILDPEVVSVFGGVYSAPGNTNIVVEDPGDGKYRVFMYGRTQGDGTSASEIRLLRLHGHITLASATGGVEWVGARDDFHVVAIINQYDYDANHILLGIEVIL